MPKRPTERPQAPENPDAELLEKLRELAEEMHRVRDLKSTIMDAKIVVGEAQGRLRASEPPSPTLNELWQWWREHPKGLLKRKSHESIRGRIENWLLPTLGHHTSESLRPPTILAFLQSLEGQLKAGTITHIRNHGSRLVRDARRYGLWPVTVPNPFADVGPIDRDEEYEAETLTIDEARRLLEAPDETRAEAPWQLRTIFAIAVYMGPRKNEILSLKIEDVDRERRLLRIKTTKVKGKTRWMPIPDELWPYIDTALERAGDGPLLFGRPDGTRHRGDYKLELRLRAALNRAGIAQAWRYKCRRCHRTEERKEKLDLWCAVCGRKLWTTAIARRITFHGLRHTCATLLTVSRCDPLVISTLLGHSTRSLPMTARYTHIDTDWDYLRTELNKLSLRRPS